MSILCFAGLIKVVESLAGALICWSMPAFCLQLRLWQQSPEDSFRTAKTGRSRGILASKHLHPFGFAKNDMVKQIEEWNPMNVVQSCHGWMGGGIDSLSTR